MIINLSLVCNQLVPYLKSLCLEVRAYLALCSVGPEDWLLKRSYLFRLSMDLLKKLELTYIHLLFICVWLSDPVDCSLSAASVHGMSQEEYWSGLPFPPPGHFPNPGRDRTHVSCIGRRILHHWATREAKAPYTQFQNYHLMANPILFILTTFLTWYFKKQIPDSVPCIICTYFSIYL